MKPSLLGRLALLATTIATLAVTQASAQQYFEIAGGANSTRAWGQYVYPNPLQDYWYTIRSQFLLRASELQFYGMPGGMIESMALRVRTSQPFTPRQLRIRIKQVTNTALTNPMDMNGFTEVYNVPAYQLPTLTNNPTWLTYQFNQPFQWDGVSNLVVDICFYRPGYVYIFPDYEYTQPSPTYATQNYFYGDVVNGCAQTVNGGLYAIRPVVRFGVLSGIEQSFPDDVDPRRILRSGSLYAGQSAEFPKPSLTFRQSTGQQIALTYRIVGPLPSTNVIYQARQAGNTTINVTGGFNGLNTFTFSDATGIAAGSGGSLDLTNIPGGAYRVEATYSIAGYSQNWYKEFNIAYPNDVSMRQIRSPLAIPRKYPRGINIPISALIQNVGLNDVTDADVTATITRASGGPPVYQETVKFEGTLRTGEVANVDLPAFNTLDVTTWNVTMCVDLKNAIDNQDANDCLPTTTTHTFQTLYNEEVGGLAIDNPSATGEYWSNRPLTPRGRIINGGMQDLSDIPVRLRITQIPGGVVYNRQIVVPDVGADPPLNVAFVDFPPFTPPAPGQYEACLITEYPGDPINANNTVCQTFTVGANLVGTYTIGTLNTGKPRNYLTFSDAVDDLYKKGVSGHVTFELTDASYTVGNGIAGLPALDLTTKIIGGGPNASITFKPSLQRSLSKGSITITLNSGNGTGILFGQSILSSNPNAVQFEFQRDPTWSNTNGYISFDGGTQKSIIVQLQATTLFRAPFYLGDGSHNISLKNLVIRNAPQSVASYESVLPIVSFISNAFTFQADTRTQGAQTLTYSAGIVSRQKLPSGRDGNNSERLDTVRGTNNTYIGNEISGFGYGVVSLGIGVAIKGGINQFMPYYSTGTVVRDNIISNVRRAGVFVGYEDGVRIQHNKIYNVGTQSTGGSNVDAAGIIVGGETRYHNINTTIDGNEISNVTGDAWSRGVKVEQARNIFPSVGSGGSIHFPQSPENTSVINNSIWNLRRASTSTNMAGVHFLTGRNTALTGINQLLTPASNTSTYFTRNDKILNNTIVMVDDNVAGSGVVTAVGVQHAGGMLLKNNAIIMRGTNLASSFSYAALTYQGVQLTDGNDPLGIVSDRNAFQLGAANAVRFIEITSNSDIISTGSTSEFANLDQWRTWTNRDLNSVTGSFYDQYEFRGIAPNQELRIKTNPAPIGSILSNRGEILSAVTTDIDGAPRGEAQQLFDIGADEFSGRQYLNDIEAVNILKPSAYRSISGPTSDAEYIMTKEGVDVQARLRNNGSLSASRTPVRVRIYLESATSNNNEATNPTWGPAVIDRVVNVDLAGGETRDVQFGIPSWSPTPYFGLPGYTVPTRFGSMSMNVTPRYRIEVTTASDENNTNNTYVKVVRFFVQKSGMRIIVSAAGSTNNLLASTPTVNQIVGRLNFDSLTGGLNRIGWINSPMTGSYAYDVFERTAWEERAVDYSMYRSLFWSSDTSRFSRFQRRDLSRFVGAGSQDEKKNVVLAGQEYARKHLGMDVINDQGWVNRTLRVQHVAPGTPFAGTYHDKRVRGDAITRNTVETIVRTGFPGDAEPLPALVRLYSDQLTSGLAQSAYVYPRTDRSTPTDSIMGSATSSLVANVIYYGVDWRHWKSTGPGTGVERVLRGSVDFIEKYGGTVVPVELSLFDAAARGTIVDVLWSTSSELQSDRFIVERADLIAGNDAEFRSIGSVPASGTSTQRVDYSYTDRDVAPGRYLYRLTTVDVDGSTERSREVEVLVTENSGTFGIDNVWPQPASAVAKVSVNVPASGMLSLRIIDAAGNTVSTIHSGTVSARMHEFEFPVSMMASGGYSIVATLDGQSIAAPMVVRR